MSRHPPRRLAVFSDDWGFHPSSCQHLTRHLLGDCEVHWLNTVGMRVPGLDAYALRRAAGKPGAWLRSVPSPPERWRRRAPGAARARTSETFGTRISALTRPDHCRLAPQDLTISLLFHSPVGRNRRVFSSASGLHGAKANRRRRISHRTRYTAGV